MNFENDFGQINNVCFKYMDHDAEVKRILEEKDLYKIKSLNKKATEVEIPKIC